LERIENLKKGKVEEDTVAMEFGREFILFRSNEVLIFT